MNTKKMFKQKRVAAYINLCFRESAKKIFFLNRVVPDTDLPVILVNSKYRFFFKRKYRNFKLSSKPTKVLPDIRPFFITGIRPDIRFHLPDIRTAGYPAIRLNC